MDQPIGTSESKRRKYFFGHIDPQDCTMQPMPIPDEWIIEGSPQTHGAPVCLAQDRMASLLVWQTTAGRFRWHYDYDEFISFIAGEAYITDTATSLGRRYGPGDTAFLPAGSVALWHVPDFVKKIALVKTALPTPIAAVLSTARTLKNRGRLNPLIQ